MNARTEETVIIRPMRPKDAAAVVEMARELAIWRVASTSLSTTS